MALRRHQKALLAASAASILLWSYPPLRPIVLPLVYLNTHLHELCHALAAVATGGRVERILVFADGSGVAPIAGGSILVVASAGYVGAALIGAALIALARTPDSARRMLWVVFGALALSMALFVRGDFVGILSGLFWVAVLPVAARGLKGVQLTFAVQFLGLQQCLTSFQAFIALFVVTTATSHPSDARILEAASGVPAIFWACGWVAFATVSIVAALRFAWAPSRRR